MACGDPIPDGVMGYEDRCVRLNAEALPPYDGDPHEGYKYVYACHADLDGFRDADGAWNAPPYPDGTSIVKESCPERPCDEPGAFVYLVALAERSGGAWTWSEYTRNFDDEQLLQIPAPQAACKGCHEDAKGIDWIYTFYDGE